MYVFAILFLTLSENYSRKIQNISIVKTICKFSEQYFFSLIQKKKKNLKFLINNNSLNK